MKFRVGVALLACAALFVPNHDVHAEGAIAEGIAPGGPAKGYGISIRVDRPNTDAARADALAGCRKGPEQSISGAPLDAGNAKARALCEVVSTFSRKCAAVALDPKDGTPGVGWAIGDTQKNADDEALARCRSVAGTNRRAFCAVTNRLCDGDAPAK
jgi:hypothetical protein